MSTTAERLPAGSPAASRWPPRDSPSPAAGGRRRPPAAAADRPPGRRADRLGQRAVPLALPAGVQPAGPLSAAALDELAGRRARAVRVLGPEASFLPVRLQPNLRWRMDAADQRRLGLDGARPAERPEYVAGSSSGCARRGRSRRATSARSAGPTARLDVELARGQGGARVAVLHRRAHRARPHRGLRAGLRPDRAGAPAADPRHPDARPDDAVRELVRTPPGRSASPPSGTCATTSGSGRRRPGTAIAELADGRRAAAGRGRRLGSARPGWTRTRGVPAGSGRGRCSARSTRWSGSGPGSSGSSGSATGWRTTPPRPSGCTATTCCRSCSATSWSRGSTSRPTGRPACCGCRPPTARTGTTAQEVAAELAVELRLMADWLELDDGRRVGAPEIWRPTWRVLCRAACAGLRQVSR